MTSEKFLVCLKEPQESQRDSLVDRVFALHTVHLGSVPSISGISTAVLFMFPPSPRSLMDRQSWTVSTAFLTLAYRFLTRMRLDWEGNSLGELITGTTYGPVTWSMAPSLSK